MPLITAVHESLPYIDPEPTPAQRAAAEALIAAERQAVPDDPDHALLAPLRPATFTPIMEAELARVAAKQPLKAIDLTRYEAAEAPPPSDKNSSAGEAAVELAAALRRAHASATYLRGRRAHLALLDSYGRNAWLVANWQLEAEVRALEGELAAAKREVDALAVQRRVAQEGVAGELRGLEEAWRAGVRSVLETEIAAERLRREVLDRRRNGGG